MIKGISKVIVFSCLLIIIAGLFNFQANAQSSSIINLSNTEKQSERVQILVYEDGVYTVWSEKFPENDETFFTKSSDGGISFGVPINLSNNEGDSAFPRLVVSEKNVYSTWYDYTPGHSDIYFSKSSDGGKNFKTVNLSNNIGASYNPWISASGENVYVVWNDDTGISDDIQRTNPNEQNVDITLGTMEILFATSHDAGNSFDVTNLSNSYDDSWNPRLRASENYVYVVWNEIILDKSEIFFATSNNYGKTFGDPINVSESSEKSDDAGIQVYEENVYLIWNEKASKNKDIFFAKSSDHGTTFSDPINLSMGTGNSIIPRDTQMAVSENFVFVVWQDNTPGNHDIFLRTSDDYGESFGPKVNLSVSPDNEKYAQVAASGENVFVIWQHDGVEGKEIFIRKSTDYGKTFGSIENISSDSNPSLIFILGPQIALSENNGYVVWENQRDKGSDLLLQTIQLEQEQHNRQILSLQTLDNSVNLEVDFDVDKFEIEQPVNFMIKFRNPTTDNFLENVNYSFVIEDSESNKLINKENQFSESGTINQTVTFQKTGPVTLLITVHGVGNEEPFDTKYFGVASAVITVVPEFPIGVITIMIIFVGITIIMSRFLQRSSSIQVNIH